jgi:hypothetical protein
VPGGRGLPGGLPGLTGTLSLQKPGAAATPGFGAGDFSGSGCPSRPSSARLVSQTGKKRNAYPDEQNQSSREISRDDGKSRRPAISSAASRSSQLIVHRRNRIRLIFTGAKISGVVMVKSAFITAPRS